MKLIKIFKISFIFKTSIALLFSLMTFSSIVIAKNSNAESTFTKARNYFFSRKFEMAKIYLEEVIRKDPEHVLAYSYLGDIYLTKKQFNKAMNIYRKALDLKPDVGENYFRIGQIYYYKKNGPMAIKNFEKGGRFHDEEESMKLDSKIVSLLNDNNIPFYSVDVGENTINDILNLILNG